MTSVIRASCSNAATVLAAIGQSSAHHTKRASSGPFMYSTNFLPVSRTKTDIRLRSELNENVAVMSHTSILTADDALDQRPRPRGHLKPDLRRDASQRDLVR